MAAFAHPAPPTTTTTSPSPVPARQPLGSARIPAGPCHFRDLNGGKDAFECGCRQFWLNDLGLGVDRRPSSVNAVPAGVWCFCGHHGCFHELHASGDPLVNPGLGLDARQANWTAHQDGVSAQPMQNDVEMSQARFVHDDAPNLLVAAQDDVEMSQDKQDAQQLHKDTPQPSRSMRNRTEMPHAKDVHYSTANGPTSRSGDAGIPQVRLQSTNQSIPEIEHAQPRGVKGLGLFETTTPAHAPAHASETPGISQLNPQNYFADYLPSTQASGYQQSTCNSVVGGVPSANENMWMGFPAQFHRPVRPQIDARNIPPTSAPPEDQVHSATEIATPSNAGTPALRQTDEAFQNLRATLEAFNRQHSSDANGGGVSESVQAGGNLQKELRSPITNQPTRDTQHSPGQLSRQIASLRMLLSATPNISTSIASLNNRLETLETASFSHIPVEEIYDRFESFDGRILDVEARLEELERAKISSRSRHRAGPSTSENVSFDSAMSDDADQLDSELIKRISAQTVVYEQRLRRLEANALPSVVKPWEIEVVLLPFSSELKGLWSNNHAASQSSPSDPSTSVLHTQSGPSKGQASDDWKTSGTEPLLARACGPSRSLAGLLHERLGSRGFVKKISIHGNSAKHIASVVLSAFHGQLALLGSRSTEAALKYPEFLGLRSPFVPLRKIHKSSTLHFLSTAELVTPAVWTADFFDSTIFMRAPSTGLRRLFITTADAYSQLKHDGPSLTWSKIRELPRFKDGSLLPVGEADALEPCWNWNSRLDPAPSFHASVSSGLSFHSSFDSHMLSPEQTSVQSSSGCSELSGSAESENGGKESERKEIRRSPTPHSPITPISSLFVSTTSRPLRPASEPHTQVETSFQPAISKRQIASFDNLSPVKKVSKRRRVSRSRSPEDVEPIELWNLTPRRSREPPSPFPYDNDSSMATSRRTSSSARRVGPSAMGAYATPYSVDVMSRGEGEGEGDGADVTDMDDDGVDDDRSEIDENDDEDSEDQVRYLKLDEDYDDESGSHNNSEEEDSNYDADDDVNGKDVPNDKKNNMDMHMSQGMNLGHDIDVEDHDDVWEGVDEDDDEDNEKEKEKEKDEVDPIDNIDEDLAGDGDEDEDEDDSCTPALR